MAPAGTIEAQSTLEGHSVEQFWMVRRYEYLRGSFLISGAIDDLREPRLNFVERDEVVGLIEAKGCSRLHAEVQHCIQSDKDPLAFRELTEEILCVCLPRSAVL